MIITYELKGASPGHTENFGYTTVEVLKCHPQSTLKRVLFEMLKVALPAMKAPSLLTSASKTDTMTELCIHPD